MKKLKWLFGLCLMALVVCGSGMSVQATDVGTDSEDDANETDVSKFRWSENDDGTLTIIGAKGTDGTVVIPSEIDGKKVTDISKDVFNYREGIRSIYLPEGITAIKDGSFSHCYNLETINIPSTVLSIGVDAFGDCHNLKNINFSEGTKDIGASAFSACHSLKYISLPNSLINIDSRCFSNCSSLLKIVIPSNVKIISRSCFFYCSSLQEVEIKNGVSEIGRGAFSKCENLKKVTIPDSITYIDGEIFSVLRDPNYSDTPKNLIIYSNPNSYARTYANQYRIKFSCLNTHDWDKGVISTQPTAIENGIKTFTCTACKTTKTEKVTKLGLPRKGKSITETKSNNTYKVIKSSAKNGTVEFAKVSKSSSSITIPNTVTVDGVIYKVTSVSKNAFKNNKKLKRVTIGKNITKINTNTFYGCKNLKTITIKSTNIESVGKNAFKGINAKAKIKVPKNKLKSYKKMFAKKGQKSTVKIVK